MTYRRIQYNQEQLEEMWKRICKIARKTRIIQFIKRCILICISIPTLIMGLMLLTKVGHSLNMPLVYFVLIGVLAFFLGILILILIILYIESFYNTYIK